EFDSLPFSPGNRLSGRIHLRFETQAVHGIDLRLTCVRRIITGSGKSQSTSNITLWQGDKNIPSGAVGPGPLGRAIPVDFELPAEALDTNHNDPRIRSSGYRTLERMFQAWTIPTISSFPYSTPLPPPKWRAPQPHRPHRATQWSDLQPLDKLAIVTPVMCHGPHAPKSSFGCVKAARNFTSPPSVRRDERSPFFSLPSCLAEPP